MRMLIHLDLNFMFKKTRYIGGFLTLIPSDDDAGILEASADGSTNPRHISGHSRHPYSCLPIREWVYIFHLVGSSNF